MFVFEPRVELTLKPSEPLGILFAKYPNDMFAQKSKDSLATFTNSLENSPDMDSKDHNLPIPAPGERNVDLCSVDIAIVNPPTFCSIIEEGPLVFSICMPMLESSISAKSSIPSDVLDDKDSVEELLNHIPHCYLEFADVFSGKNADKLPPRCPYNHLIPLKPSTIPPYGPIYKQSESKLKVIKNFIDEYLAKGFIRPSQSPSSTPVVFAKKKDGSL
jgi:hypothetical protein